ncbi:hypothetical protein KUTeg_015695 [Tegillarca granosa]|uniref:Uncharacterized protein n=1 Tax=Tegillarca granosa TaxID=220873 RepID=A0ABQ9EQV8_TEGGR|nr:hypothetical protein KUTeg_015695 [Tegillarca granosa]
MHTQHMRQMQSMFQNPFGGLGMGMPNRMLEPPRRSDNQGAVQRRRQDPFGDLMGGMGGFPSMFGNMEQDDGRDAKIICKKEQVMTQIVIVFHNQVFIPIRTLVKENQKYIKPHLLHEEDLEEFTQIESKV